MPSNIIAIIAIYGAILSSITAFWLWRDRHPQIRIRLYAAIEATHDDTDIFIVWRAQNIGAKPLTLTEAGFILPNKLRYFIGLSEHIGAFPHEIVPGNDYILSTRIKTIVHGFQEIGLFGAIQFTGFGSSETGEVFRGGELKLDITSGKLIQGEYNKLRTLISGTNQ